MVRMQRLAVLSFVFVLYFEPNSCGTLMAAFPLPLIIWLTCRLTRWWQPATVQGAGLSMGSNLGLRHAGRQGGGRESTTINRGFVETPFNFQEVFAYFNRRAPRARSSERFIACKNVTYLPGPVGGTWLHSVRSRLCQQKRQNSTTVYILELGRAQRRLKCFTEKTPSSNNTWCSGQNSSNMMKNLLQAR